MVTDRESEVSRMADMMTFPATVEEFMEQYKIVDDEKVYTNGADLVPIFRMMQWFEHVSATDTISRQQAIDVAKGPVVMQGIRSGKSVTAAAVDAVKCIIVDGLRDLPPAQPEIIRCKDCKHLFNKDDEGGKCWHFNGFSKVVSYDDFCSLAERREVTE